MLNVQQSLLQRSRPCSFKTGFNPRPGLRNPCIFFNGKVFKHFTSPYRRDQPQSTSARIFTMAPAEVPAAVLPGTPSTFSIPADKLIALAQKVSEANSGVDDPDLLADNFRFEFPVVSLAKKVSCID